MNVCILTSCIIPNTDIAVSALTPEQRLSDLLSNVGFLHSLGLFDLVLIADPSLNHSGTALRNSLQSSVEKLRSEKSSTDVWLYFPGFSDDQLKTIGARGKGYSELLILQAAIGYLKEKSISAGVIFKLSARYRVLNIKALVGQMLRRHSRGASFCCEVNRISSKVNTVFYSLASSFGEKICDLKELVDDSRGVYVERVFYGNLFLDSCVRSSRVGPLVYSFSLSSGSKALTYGLRAQCLRIVASLL